MTLFLLLLMPLTSGNGVSYNISTRHNITNTANNARSVFAIDVDGDTDIDVLSASASDDVVAWYEGEFPDTANPQITIASPGNNTNTTNTGLNINYTVSDDLAIAECYWTNNSALHNYSLGDDCVNITNIT